MSTRSTEREQFLADIIISAVEGGTGYWAAVSRYRHDCPAADTTATLHDEDDGKVYVLTIDTIATGIGRVLGDGFKVRGDILDQVKCGSRENDAGEIDADGADVIVQAALFGEVVYG